MDDQQVQTLIRASLQTSYYKIGSIREELLKLYSELLYKECNIPLPGVILDLVGSLGLRLPQNNNILEISESISYRNFFFLSFQHSPECKKIRELVPLEPEYFWPFCSRFLEIFFTRLRVNVIDINAVQMRDLLPELINVDSEDELASSFVSEDDDWMMLLDRSQITHNFQSSKPILEEEDFWDLSQIKLIKSDSLRFALRECYRWRNWLTDRANYFLARVRKEVHYSLSDYKKKSGNYPVGGISELSNRGSLENLLRSELIYSETDTEIDLFQVRYVEGELLYYQRDSNQIDQQEEEVHIFLYSREFYPYTSGSRIHPFFIYSILLFWVENASKVHPSLKFKFNLHVLENGVRDKEFLSVLRSFGTALIKMDRLILHVSEKFEHFKKCEDPRELHIGSSISGKYCIDWCNDGWIIQEPHYSSNKASNLRQLNFDESCVLDAAVLGMKFIFDQVVRTGHKIRNETTNSR